MLTVAIIAGILGAICLFSDRDEAMDMFVLSAASLAMKYLP